MGILDQCKALFETSDLYKVLGVKKDADVSQIRKGYHKKALKAHPDKAKEGEKEKANEIFGALSGAYAVLSNDESRKVYDETGCVDDGSSLGKDDGQSWEEYFKTMFSRVSVNLLDDDKASYQHSDQEKADVKAAYLAAEGDMDGIMATIIHAVVVEDEDRFRKLIKAMIKKGEVPEFGGFVREPKKRRDSRKRKSIEEAAEVPKAKSAMDDITSKRGNLDLMALIRGNQANRSYATIEAKYSKGKKKLPTEPSDEEFAAAQAKWQGRGASNGGGGGSGSGKKGGNKKGGKAAAAGGGGKKKKR